MAPKITESEECGDFDADGSRIMSRKVVQQLLRGASGTFITPQFNTTLYLNSKSPSKYAPCPNKCTPNVLWFWKTSFVVLHLRPGFSQYSRSGRLHWLQGSVNWHWLTNSIGFFFWFLIEVTSHLLNVVLPLMLTSLHISICCYQ
jgi:hypothetical protein